MKADYQTIAELDRVRAEIGAIGTALADAEASISALLAVMIDEPAALVDALALIRGRQRELAQFEAATHELELQLESGVP